MKSSRSVNEKQTVRAQEKRRSIERCNTLEARAQVKGFTSTKQPIALLLRKKFPFLLRCSENPHPFVPFSASFEPYEFSNRLRYIA